MGGLLFTPPEMMLHLVSPRVFTPTCCPGMMPTRDDRRELLKRLNRTAAGWEVFANVSRQTEECRERPETRPENCHLNGI